MFQYIFPDSLDKMPFSQSWKLASHMQESSRAKDCTAPCCVYSQLSQQLKGHSVRQGCIEPPQASPIREDPL